MKSFTTSVVTLSALVTSLYGAVVLAAPPTPSVNAFIVNDSVPVEATIVNGPVPVHDAGDPARHVFLNWSLPSGGSSCLGSEGFVQVDDDGNSVGGTPGTEFIVPAGYVLNVTDISWSAYSAGSSLFTPGSSLVFSLGVDGGNTPVYRSTPVLVTDANYLAFLGGNESLSAGINVGSGNKLCVGLVEYGTSQVSRDPRVVHLRGMLMPTPSR